MSTYNYFGENEVVLFHGTHVNPGTIISEGFGGGNSIWSCSNCEKAYFYEYRRWCECESYEPYEDEDPFYVILRRANEQGQIQNAVLKNPENITSVFEFHFPEDIKEYIEGDDSCEHMTGFGSVQIDTDIINQYIKEGRCKVFVHTYDFSTKCSLLYLTGIWGNRHIDKWGDLTSYELSVLDTLTKGEFNEYFYETCISNVEEHSHYEIMLPVVNM